MKTEFQCFNIIRDMWVIKQLDRNPDVVGQWFVYNGSHSLIIKGEYEQDQDLPAHLAVA